MKFFYVFTVLIIVVFCHVSGTQHRGKPAHPRIGYTNYIARPRFRNRFGDETEKNKKINFDYNSLFRNEEMDVNTKRELIDTDEALQVDDQRPKGSRPYHMRRRYFGGKKRSEEAEKNAKRVASNVLNLRDRIFDDRIHAIRNGNIRSVSEAKKDHYDDLKYIITPNDMAVNDNTRVANGGTKMQDDLEKISDVELDAAINSFRKRKDARKSSASRLQRQNNDFYTGDKTSEINLELDEDDYNDLNNAAANNDGDRRMINDGEIEFRQLNDGETNNDDDFRALFENQ